MSVSPGNRTIGKLGWRYHSALHSPQYAIPRTKGTTTKPPAKTTNKTQITSQMSTKIVNPLLKAAPTPPCAVGWLLWVMEGVGRRKG